MKQIISKRFLNIVLFNILFLSSLSGQNILIVNGWQLKGAEENINNLSIFTNNCVSSIWTYDTTWKAYSPNSTMLTKLGTDNIISSINKGDGYWVNGNKNCIIDMNMSNIIDDDFEKLYFNHISLALNEIDIENSNSLYFSQLKFMIAVEFYNHNIPKYQNELLKHFSQIINDLPNLNDLRDLYEKGQIELDEYYLDKLRSGDNRRIFPIMNKEKKIIYIGNLNVVQFSYLISRLTKNIIQNTLVDNLNEEEKEFIKLAVDFLHNDIVIPLYSDTEAWWYTEAGGAFLNMEQRILAKLDYENSSKLKISSYYSAFIDEEFFLMAIASDLKFIHNKMPFIYYNNETIQSILAKITKILDQRLEDEGFLLDIGKWKDHPVYKYANYNGDTYPNTFYIKEDVSMDTSHSYRWPLWLDSFKNAYDKDSEEYNYYNDLILRLSYQFEKVVRYTDYGPLLNNYIDGTNGWYNLKKYWGYGPFSLSTTARHGSWYLLPNDNNTQKFIRSMENMINSTSEKVIDFRTKYFGEYDHSLEIDERGIRTIDLMGKESLAALVVKMGKIINQSKNDK